MTFVEWCKTNNEPPLWVLIHDLRRWERALARHRRYLDRQKCERKEVLNAVLSITTGGG